MVSMGTVWIIFLFQFSVFSWANCEPVDFRPELGPPRHQGNSGFCFAHTSADLLSQAIGTRVSAMDIGVNFVLGDEKKVRASSPPLKNYLKRNPTFLDQWKIDRGAEPENLKEKNILTEDGVVFVGGTEPTALFLSNFFGLCEDKNLPSREAKSFENHLQSIRSYHKKRMRSGDCETSEVKEPIGEVKEWMAKLAAHSLVNWVNEACGKRIYPPKPIIPEMKSVADSYEDFLEKTKKNKIDAKTSNQQMFREVDKQLSNGKAVAIGATWNDLLKVDPRYPIGDHSFVVAARKSIEGECHYFIRNSVGEDKSDYLPRFKKRYEQGGVWIKKSELPSIYSVTYLE
jgi:hypothetical protein